MFIVDALAPKEYPRVVKKNSDSRDALRPSKLAAAAKVRHVCDHLIADGIDADDWEEEDEWMPDEDKAEDRGMGWAYAMGGCMGGACVACAGGWGG